MELGAAVWAVMTIMLMDSEVLVADSGAAVSEPPAERVPDGNGTLLMGAVGIGLEGWQPKTWM